jgi:hypothetical protein
MVRAIEEMGGFRWHGAASAHLGSALGLRLYSAPSDAAITHTTADLNFDAAPRAKRSIQPNFHCPDIDVIAFNLPPIQFDNRE